MTDPLRSNQRLHRAGEIALLRAKQLWLETIVDPPSADPAHATSRARIDDLIRGEAGLHWRWLRPYGKNGDFAWCGAFAAHAWAGAGLAHRWRHHFFSSAYRLDRWGRHLPFEDQANPPPADAPRRWLALDERSTAAAVRFPDGTGPQPGDLLLVGDADSGCGSHVTLVEAFDAAAGTFTTIEGNGSGAAPDGRRIHGVVRAQRAVGVRPGNTAGLHARRLIRPSIHDLDRPGEPS